MQYSLARPAQQQWAALAHVDGRVLPQVLRAEHNPWLHQLLVEVGERVGLQAVFVVNRKDRTIASALKHLDCTAAEYLVVEDVLFSCKV